MATYDSADLFAMLQAYAHRPAVDELLTTTLGYDLLSEAQTEAYLDIIPRAPTALMGQPTQLVTADSGVTYTFGTDGEGNNIFPGGHAEIYGTVNGVDLYASSWSDAEGDFVIEGAKIRMPGNTPRTFTSGPYGRFVAVPLRLDGSTAPALTPVWGRPIIVWKALEKFAAIGGMRDDRMPREKYQEWLGKLLLFYRTQYKNRNAPAGNPRPSHWGFRLSSNG